MNVHVPTLPVEITANPDPFHFRVGALRLKKRKTHGPTGFEHKRTAGRAPKAGTGHAVAHWLRMPDESQVIRTPLLMASVPPVMRARHERNRHKIYHHHLVTKATLFHLRQELSCSLITEKLQSLVPPATPEVCSSHVPQAGYIPQTAGPPPPKK